MNNPMLYESDSDHPPANGCEQTEKDLLIPDSILPHLSSEGIGRPLLVLKEVSSTNSYLLQRSQLESPHGLTVAAECQSAGRGRHGRVWHAPASRNLTFSICLRPSWHPGGLTTLLGGCATVAALREMKINASLKWPNDIIESAGQKKLGGVLCETAFESDGSMRLVLGIGLNVNMQAVDFPEALHETASSLSISTGERYDRSLLLGRILARINSFWDALQEDRGEALVEFARSACDTLGHLVMIQIGDRQIEGWAQDIDRLGRLVLRLDGGFCRIIEMGEITSARRLV